MQLFFHHPAGPKPQSDRDLLVPLHEREFNTSEGGEFLDDAIRMEDEIPFDQQPNDHEEE